MKATARRQYNTRRINNQITPNSMTYKEKILTAKINLFEKIKVADMMILHDIQTEARNIRKKMIEDRMFTKDNQKIVEFTVDEFTELRLFLSRLSTDTKALHEIGHCESYIQDKKSAEEFLQTIS